MGLCYSDLNETIKIKDIIRNIEQERNKDVKRKFLLDLFIILQDMTKKSD
jgi:hypothetical protein